MFVYKYIVSVYTEGSDHPILSFEINATQVCKVDKHTLKVDGNIMSFYPRFVEEKKV